MPRISVIILAAGKGTRMKSDRAKVLHEVAGVSMIQYIVKTALAVVKDVVVVIGHEAEAVQGALTGYPGIRFALQREQLGTGHAVMTALPFIPGDVHDAVILCGDTPLIKADTIRALIAEHRSRKAKLTLVTTKLDRPFGYGRIITDEQGRMMRIVEESDASESEKAIATVNSGAYCVHIDFLKDYLPSLSSDNAQGEFYLTDVVAHAYANGIPTAMLNVYDSFEVLGVNTIDDLAQAEALLTRS